MHQQISAAEYRRRWDPSEAAFQAQVIEVAQELGWTVFHVYDMRRSEKGWPDLALVKPGRLILWELKTNRGRVRPEQRLWLDLLNTVPGVVCGVLRPRDWDGAFALLSDATMIP